MGISVNNILDAGLITNGKFPDIYWELELTGSELKILRYIFNNCLRLYKDLKYFPIKKLHKLYSFCIYFYKILPTKICKHP